MKTIIIALSLLFVAGCADDFGSYTDDFTTQEAQLWARANNNLRRGHNVNFEMFWTGHVFGAHYAVGEKGIRGSFSMEDGDGYYMTVTHAVCRPVFDQ